MTDLQLQFLELAILQQMKYADISVRLDVDQKILSRWWDELKSEREKLSALRQIWKRKCETASFQDFKIWFESTERKCHYCGITEVEIEQMKSRGLINTKHIVTRGRKLEIERVLANVPYDNLHNLVFCCYWCNNAKSDEFSEEEFKPMGQLISTIWKQRLRNDRFTDNGRNKNDDF